MRVIKRYIIRYIWDPTGIDRPLDLHMPLEPRLDEGNWFISQEVAEGELTKYGKPRPWMYYMIFPIYVPVGDDYDDDNE
jgi:hypothetical protein